MTFYVIVDIHNIYINNNIVNPRALCHTQEAFDDSDE